MRNLEINESSTAVQWGLTFSGIISLLLVWYIVTAVLHMFPSTALPSPVAVLDEYLRVSGLINNSLINTLSASVVGFGIAVGLALLFGVAMTFSSRLNRALFPLLVGGNSVPRIALAPIIIFYVGGEAQAKYLISAWVAFFPMLVNTLDGLDGVDEDLISLLNHLDASVWQELKWVRFPHSLPYLFDGLKIAVILSIIGAVVAEFIVTSSGIGFLALLAMRQLNMALAFAVVILTGIVSTTAFFLLFLLQDRLVHWKETNIFPE